MTPAIRVAEYAGVAIGIHEYRHDPSVTDFGREASEALGVGACRVFKTLVVEVERQPNPIFVLAVIQVLKTLNLKAVASALGRKYAKMAHSTKAERVTGYVRGGISPLGTRQRLVTFLDDAVFELDEIYCSGGKRGLDISIRWEDLVELTDAKVLSIAK